MTNGQTLRLEIWTLVIDSVLEGTVAEWHFGQQLPRSAANGWCLRGLSNLIGLVVANRFRSNGDQFLIQKPIRRQSLE